VDAMGRSSEVLSFLFMEFKILIIKFEGLTEVYHIFL
jgi:hypothetical protein